MRFRAKKTQNKKGQNYFGRLATILILIIVCIALLYAFFGGPGLNRKAAQALSEWADRYFFELKQDKDIPHFEKRCKLLTECRNYKDAAECEENFCGFDTICYSKYNADGDYFGCGDCNDLNCNTMTTGDCIAVGRNMCKKCYPITEPTLGTPGPRGTPGTIGPSLGTGECGNCEDLKCLGLNHKECLFEGQMYCNKCFLGYKPDGEYDRCISCSEIKDCNYPRKLACETDPCKLGCQLDPNIDRREIEDNYDRTKHCILKEVST